MKDTTKPMLFSLADALEIDLQVTHLAELTGSSKKIMEVFEGYSPTVVTSVIDSLVDEHNGVIGVCVQIWGNLNVMCINDSRSQLLSLYVYDRSKIVKGSFPFDTFWSRQHTYKFLGSCVKGVYSRSIYDTVWAKLEKGPSALRIYNDMRQKGIDADTAYMAMWGDK